MLVIIIKSHLISRVLKQMLQDMLNIMLHDDIIRCF